MNWDYRSIISGQRKDPAAILLRGGLFLASGLYGVAVRLRNRGYDRGRSETHRSEAIVISVGNLTTGGTGKTPIVCFLARWLRRRGLRVAIVSRGYGRGDADVNDEALELYDRLPDVPHVQDPDRVEAARVAVEELESQVILMDDGFQHRRLERDLDIVVIDATCPFGYGHLLPRGLLREPVRGLERAGLVMLTRCGLVDNETLEAIEREIHQVNSDLPLVRCDHRPAHLREFPAREVSLDSLAASSVAVVSAIGNPTAFEKTVESCGAAVIAATQLADHDPYDRDTVEALCKWIESIDEAIDQVICTHKDLVKLRTDRLAGKPLRALLIELTIDRNPEALEEAMAKTVEKAGRQ